MKIFQISTAFLMPLALITAMPASITPSALLPREPTSSATAHNSTSASLTKVDSLTWRYDPIEHGKVNGWAALTLFRDGTVSYTGHLHVDGAQSYKAAVSLVIKDSQGVVYAVGEEGKLCGSLECPFGSTHRHDHDWNKVKYVADVARGFDAIAAGWEYQYASSTSGLTLEDMINTLTERLDDIVREIRIFP